MACLLHSQPCSPSLALYVILCMWFPVLVSKKEDITEKLRNHLFLWLQTFINISCLDTYPQEALEHIWYAMCFMLCYTWEVYSYFSIAIEIPELTHIMPKTLRDGQTDCVHLGINLPSRCPVEVIVLPCLTSSSYLKDQQCGWPRFFWNGIC